MDYGYLAIPVVLFVTGIFVSTGLFNLAMKRLTE